MNYTVIEDERILAEPMDRRLRFSADRADDAIAGSLAGWHPVGCALHIFRLSFALCRVTSLDRPSSAIAVGRVDRAVVVAQRRVVERVELDLDRRRRRLVGPSGVAIH
jgi:hypothetical protein